MKALAILAGFNLIWATSLLANEDTAEQAFQRGDFVQAIEQWQQETARPATQWRMATAYQHLGYYQKAQQRLESLSASTLSPTQQAQLALAWSRLYFAKGSEFRSQADQALQQALTLTHTLDAPWLKADVLQHQGVLQHLDFLFSTAEQSYQQALAALHPQDVSTSPSTHARDVLLGKIYVNRWRNLHATQDERAAHAWQDALELWQAQAPSAAQVTALLQLASDSPKAQQEHLFAQAYQQAQRLGNVSLQAYAAGLWGQQVSDSKQALRLTREALFFAQQAPDQARLYRWYHQLARLLQQQDDTAATLQAYRQAVQHLRSRWYQESYQGYRVLLARFENDIKPLYMDFVEWLVQQQRLQEAIEVVEQFKRLELEGYLQTPCKNLNQQACPLLKTPVPQHTAIIYPLMFQQHLTVLVKIGEQLHSLEAPVKTADLKIDIALLSSLLRRPPYPVPSRDPKAAATTYDCATLPRSPSAAHNPFQNSAAVLKPAQRLYQWLIEPLQALLQKADIQHLLIVPDGMLRTVPFAVLHNGQHYLIQDYAISVSPGLCMSPALKAETTPSLLLGGLSVSVDGMPALQCVNHELDAVQQLYSTQTTETLLNQQFTTPNLSQHWGQKSHNILHLASHGQFSAQVKETFILTYDGKLSLNDLSRLVRQKTQSDQPVDLLTLSACETAAGNDRAALGLAGVAVKAGARHALATLWRIDDRVTPLVLTEFYRQLQNAGVSKAQALQRAQRAVLEKPVYAGFQHPYYWAAFLLIGGY